MRIVIAMFLAVACVAVVPPRAAAASKNLILQVQAADVLADLLTAIDNHADARVKAMRAYLKKIGKSDAYDDASPLVRLPRRLDFQQVFEGAQLFVKNGGDQYADPDILKMTDSQLTDQLVRQQSYNRDQFMHLGQQREAAASMRSYMESIGEFDKYEAWALDKVPATNPATTQPPAQSPEEMAARMDEFIEAAKEIEWQKAKAMGMSQADFEKKWQDQVQRNKDSVANRLNGMQKLAAAFAQSETPAAPAAKNRTIVGGATPINTWQNSGQPQPGQPALPPPVDSTHTKELYEARSLETWNRWNDGYWDTQRRPGQ